MARLTYPPRARRPAAAAELASTIRDRSRGADRFMVALAGPPGAGKSTLAAALADHLASAGEKVAVMPMDGFHLDNAILDSLGLRARKGAPETFDTAGLAVLLKRLRTREPDVAIPLFDRAMDLARAGAQMVSADTRLLLVEGNYLLLDEMPWRGLGALFDLTVFLDVPRAELETRLVRRWLQHGHDQEQARLRALSNDIPNALRVITGSRPPDIAIRG